MTEKTKRIVPAVSTVLATGKLVELVFDPIKKETAFAIGTAKHWSLEKQVEVNADMAIIPYGPDNNLIAHQVILLPSKPTDYGDTAALVEDIQKYIHTYMDIPPDFEIAVCYYVLFSWLYDKFQEVPYLRFTGDYGTGKTRFLLIVGSLLYRPIFASGASTVSPIFHGLNSFRGSLVMDEADFRFSDEKSEVVKILNNGNVNGFVVLRSEVNQKTKEFNPKAFNVFGPKLIVTRGAYDDQALESRFISCSSSGKKVRTDIPLNLTDQYKQEALELRNKLLRYRMKNYAHTGLKENLQQENVEARIKQIYLPLLSIIENPEHRKIVAGFASDSQHELQSMRDETVEASLLAEIAFLQQNAGSARISLNDIAIAYRLKHREEVSNRWVGMIVRRKLHLQTERIGGAYYLTDTAVSKLPALYERFDIEPDAPGQDFQDF